jgi:hypothetical protein
MQYMLLYYVTPADLAQRDDPKEAAEYMGAWGAYIGAMSAAGVMSSGQGLQPPQTASTVRVRNGKRQVQDGPYADTREHLGGYVVLDVATLDQALEWAARAPCAATGGTEVRPVLPPMQSAM